jgi:hypothetical protein
MPNKLLILILLFAFFGLAFNVRAQAKKCEQNETFYNLPCMKRELPLVDRKVTIKVYTKTEPNKLLDRTFVVVHANEKNGLDGAKKVISENYGRLVEIVSNAPDEDNKRYLYFGNGKCIDPNRIYTSEGVKKTLADSKKPCGAVKANDNEFKSIESFAKEFIKTVTNEFTHSFIIGVHNNDYSLSPNTWSKDGDEAKTALGIFLANDHEQSGVFPTSSHNFILATNGRLFGKLLDNGIYSVALQENRDYLIKKNLDDGSMSIYFGTTALGTPAKLFDYINIEAGGKNDDNAENKKWQRTTIKKVIEMKLS